MPGILGTKIGMTRVVAEDGTFTPVTVIECLPNVIVQVKTPEKDGYSAIVLGYKERNRPTKNKKFYFQREFRVANHEDYKIGDTVDVSLFEEAKAVTICAKSKGKGFQGVIKRHNFSRGPETHGSHHHRAPGSIGACAMPGRVAKGKKLPGRHGGAQVTVKKVEVVMIDKANNVIAVKGPVTGSIKNLVKITLES